MKILFVVNDMSFIELLGVMQLSALAKEIGHRTRLGIINEHDILKLTGNERPDVVALSIMSVDAKVFEDLARAIKHKYKDILLIAGGTHPTFNPEIIDTWALDAIFVGEADGAFTDFLRIFDGGNSYLNIQNLHTKIQKNQLRPLVDDLDSLPFPDRDLVYFKGGHLIDLNIRTFMASRGCAYNCTYCFNNKYRSLYLNKGRIVRRRSVNNIIEEILKVREKYPFNFVRFGDDNFLYRVDEWVEEFSREYKKRVNMPFYCLLRPNLVTEEMVKLLKSAGCHSVSMSIESGSENIRRTILKRKISDEEIKRAFDIVHDNGIYVYANSMVGIPYARTSDEIKTVGLAVKCKPIFPSFSVFTPFRGVELAEIAYKNHLVDGELPERTSGRSVLNCFTEKEKDLQENIVKLGPLAVNYPFLRPLIMNFLIYLPPNRLFFLIWVIYKNYLGTRYIWPIRGSLLYKLKLLSKALLFEGSWYKKLQGEGNGATVHNQKS